jgi:hypothetical protein
MESAVCLTGLERSFAEIGANVREGVLGMLGARTSFFGVRPANASWDSIAELLPMVDLQVQRGHCWSREVQDRTITWMHCDFRLRGGDCRLSFLQALCDLSQCEDMIAAHERSVLGREYDVVMRLRPDLFWESAMTLPSPLSPKAVYIPGMDNQGGANDHLAVGLRAAMRLYLTRLRHSSRPGAVQRLKGLGSEGYLAASLQWDELQVHRLQQWMYCPHTPRNLLRDSGRSGCVARVRCRTACTSLWCPSASMKGGECECLNETCATFAAGRGAATGGGTAVLGPGAKSPEHRAVQFRHFRKPASGRNQRDWLGWCTDVGGKQLFHSDTEVCPWGGARRRAGGEASVSSLTAKVDTTMDTTASAGAVGRPLAPAPGPLELKSCFFVSRRVDRNLTRREHVCPKGGAAKKGSFAGSGGRWPWL